MNVIALDDPSGELVEVPDLLDIASDLAAAVNEDYDDLTHEARRRVALVLAALLDEVRTTAERRRQVAKQAVIVVSE